MEPRILFYVESGAGFNLPVYAVEPRVVGRVFEKGRNPEWGGNEVPGESNIIGVDPRYAMDFDPLVWGRRLTMHVRMGRDALLNLSKDAEGKLLLKFGADGSFLSSEEIQPEQP